MNCKVCNQVIEKEVNYCPNCGAELSKEEIKTFDDLINSNDVHNNKFPDSSTTPNSTLTIGILAFALALILGKFYSIGALILGGYGVVVGVKSLKILKSRKATWGIILSSLGIFVAILSLITTVVFTKYVSKVDERLSKELDFELPNIMPGYYFLGSKSIPMESYVFDEFYYQLDDQIAEEIINKAQNDERFHETSYLEEFASEFPKLKFDVNGVYLVYDRLTETNELPSDFSKLDFVMLIYDIEEKQIIIYEITK